MIKTISAALLATSLMVAPAAAELVFEEVSGDWTVRGYALNADPDDVSCVTSTEWGNGDRINLNVFPHNNGTNNFTMTIKNELWNRDYFHGDKTEKYGGYARFNTAGTIDTGEFGWEWYTANDKQTIIIRDLSDSFLSLWTSADTLSLFPGEGETNEMVISLLGTSKAEELMFDCIDVVQGAAD